MIDDDDISDGDVKVIKHPTRSESHVAHVPLKDNTFAIRGFYLLKTDGQDYNIRRYTFIKNIFEYIPFLQKLNS